MTTLPAFLEARRVTHANWNITGMSKHVGKYHIDDDEYGEFLQAYHEYVFVAKRPAFLLERHSPTASPILIDLDFRYPLTTPLQRAFTHTNITHFVSNYAAAFHRFIVFDSPLRFYVQQIPTPLIDKDQCKDGIHIVCPDIALKYEDLFVLRKYTLDNNIIISSFPGLTNTPTDCFDESVIKRNNWFLYGSSKSPERVPYSTATCFVLEPDGTLTEESARESPMEYVSTFSIRAAEPSPYTIRPDMVEEWNTWNAISDQKPKKTTTTTIVPYNDDTESVASHLSVHISKIIKHPGLVWEVLEVDDGYKLTHNSKRCLVATDTDHSTIGHSCVFVTDSAANLVCFSHKSKRLPKAIASALWNMLSNKTIVEDEMTARYTTIKAEFERKNFRILDPPGYMTMVGDSWVHYNRALIIDMNSGMFVDDEKKCRFTDWWLRDDTIRTYARTGYYVDEKECPPNIFNTFAGFAGARASPQTVQADLTPIMDHVRILCNHQADAIEFFLDWFASIVQNPGTLNGIALVVIGTHGCGKDIFLNWFGSKIIGMENYYKTARPHVDLFGSFNSSRKNVLFYHIEEANSSSVPPALVEQFKNYITDPYASIQMKNKNTTTGESLVKNYNHFAISTNFNVPFQIERSERRVFAVKASAEKCRNHAYFQRLIEAMENTDVVSSFYTFLRVRDIAHRDWCNPPATDSLTAWKMECMPKLEPFIDYFKTTNSSPCTILASRLYAAYIEWCETTEEESMSIRSFGLELKQLSGVAKGHSMTGNIYTIL
jgi:hypothetical protein